jgi:REP element-mobilizing transposase RayT
MELHYLLGLYCGKDRLIGHEQAIKELLYRTAEKNNVSITSIDVMPSFIIMEIEAGIEDSPLNLVRMLKGVVGWYLAQRDSDRRIRDIPFIIRTVGALDRGAVCERMLGLDAQENHARAKGSQV